MRSREGSEIFGWPLSFLPNDFSSKHGVYSGCRCFFVIDLKSSMDGCLGCLRRSSIDKFRSKFATRRPLIGYG